MHCNTEQCALEGALAARMSFDARACICTPLRILEVCSLLTQFTDRGK